MRIVCPLTRRVVLDARPATGDRSPGGVTVTEATAGDIARFDALARMCAVGEIYGRRHDLLRRPVASTA